MMMMQSSQPPQPMYYSQLPPPPQAATPTPFASPPVLPPPAKPKSSRPPWLEHSIAPLHQELPLLLRIDVKIFGVFLLPDYQSGAVVDIIVDDGKPVSLDMPLLVIEP
uniref:Lipoyl-binding domain-containing protein n=1 Tax=Lactuca sativa TaxID=4236 RepID=A0A9R1VDC4_LACSA|nr:hypothetical protein LSAT_V11C500297930 [Lactuca sativa]